MNRYCCNFIKMLKKNILSIVAILLLVLAYTYDGLINQTSRIEHYANKIESEIQNYEAEITKTFEDKDFVDRLINYEFDLDEVNLLDDLSTKYYSLFIYKQPDSLVFWSNNRILPFDADVEFIDENISGFSTIKNGGYAILNLPYSYKNEDYALVGLIPIRYEYSIQNEFIENGIAILEDIPKEIILRFEPTDYIVKNSAGKILFYLDSDGDFTDYSQQIIILIIYLFGLILLFYSYHQYANQVVDKFGGLFGIAFLLLITFLTRWVIILLGFWGKFSEVSLFDTNYFDDNVIFSLGSFLVNAVIIFWLMLFTYKRLRIPEKLLDNKKLHLPIVIIIHLAIIVGVLLTTETFRNLIVYAEVNFDIENLYRLHLFPLIGTLTLSIILLTLFTFLTKFKFLARKFDVSIQHRLLIQGIILVIASVLYFLEIVDLAFLFSVIFGIIIIFLTRVFIHRSSVGFLWLVGWICTFAIYSSILFYQFNAQKELNNRIFYAQNLALERDTEMEDNFDNIAARITQDHFIKRISNPFFARNKIIEQIEEAYLQENFSNKYEYEIHLYTSDSVGTKGEIIPFDYYAEYLADSKKTENESLYYWNNGIGEQRYIANLPIVADNRKYYKIIIDFTPKTVERLSGLPELLLDKSFDLQKRFDEYDYAIYKEGIKIKDNSNQYAIKLDFKIPVFNNSKVVRENRNYLIHQTSDNRIIIIGKDNQDWGSVFSLFSYMFCLFMVVISVLLTVNRISEKTRFGRFLQVATTPSLRNKIQNNVVAIVVLSFIGIGVTTVIYFQSESQEYHAGRLGRKAKAVLKMAEHEMQTSLENLDSFYLPNIFALSDIHNLDVNLYDYDGEMIESSQKAVFSKNLLSRRIEPIARHQIYNLNQEMIYRDERIGNLYYNAAYLPVKRLGKTVAFLGLPYYTAKENTRQDIGAFMGRLMNVYVIIFIFAGVVTFVLTGQITNPLDKLSKQMQNVKLGKKNDPLSWDKKDEIGLLIEEYNTMLEELERSANLLAKSEREGAWREMAKQVAHEIKNPLTPMKLQIQFLQRAYKSRPEDIGPLLKRTAYTLVEQIDGLTRIASDFSNFAKMPTANNEHLILNSIVGSVYQLFSHEEEVEVILNLTNEETPVFADKDQLIRVFNNIIKNAIQAITLDIDYATGGKVTINLNRKGKWAVISVTDNGTGIPEDKRDKVFVPNFTTKSSGTGLGLAMSKNIVEAAGGNIYFETELKVGTTFYVELPILVTGH